MGRPGRGYPVAVREPTLRRVLAGDGVETDVVISGFQPPGNANIVPAAILIVLLSVLIEVVTCSPGSVYLIRTPRPFVAA